MLACTEGRSGWNWVGPLSYGQSKGAMLVFFAMSIGAAMVTENSEVFECTLALMILKTLH